MIIHSLGCLSVSGSGQKALLGTSMKSTVPLELMNTGSLSIMALNFCMKYLSLLLCFEWCQKLRDCDPSRPRIQTQN